MKLQLPLETLSAEQRETMRREVFEGLRSALPDTRNMVQLLLSLDKSTTDYAEQVAAIQARAEEDMSFAGMILDLLNPVVEELSAIKARK